MEVWDLYFATMAGWMMHPGYCKDGSRPPSLEECADIADKMCAMRAERLGFDLYKERA